MPNVFLSHSSDDKKITRTIAAELTRHGIGVWIDEAEIKVGDSLISKIADGIEETDFVAAIISRTSVESAWVRKELQLAMTREIEGKRLVVLPVLVDKCVVPFFLRDKFYADLRSSKDFEEGLARLVNSVLKRHVPGRMVVKSAGSKHRDSMVESDLVGADMTPLPDKFAVVSALGVERGAGGMFLALGIGMMAFSFALGRADFVAGLLSVLAGSALAVTGVCLLLAVNMTRDAFERDRSLLLDMEQVGPSNLPFVGDPWKSQWRISKRSAQIRTALVFEGIAVVMVNIGLLLAAAALFTLFTLL